MKKRKLKSGVTIFARGVIYLIGLAAFAVCFILLPELAREEGARKPFDPFFLFWFFAFVYTLAGLFFVSLFQAHKLLGYIDKNKAFSPESLKALQIIKICAIVIATLLLIATIALTIFLRVLHPSEDAPPFPLFGGILTFSSAIVAVFVAVFQKLIADAVTLKSENDLIV